MNNNNMNLRKKLIVNTISNYGKLIVSMLITIFMTRILFLGLSRSDYGFWALLWSIFGYSLLLDFGFGSSIQKYTSECSISKDWNKLNKIVSTVYFNYLGVSLIIIIATIVLAFNVQHLFSFDINLTNYYRNALLVFGIGSAVVFPIGFFTEILRGLQALHLRNIINVIIAVLNFTGMFFVVYYLKLESPLIWMSFVAIGTTLISCTLMNIVAHKLIPELSIRWKHYDRKSLKSVMSFSLYAYVITFSNLIIFKTDQLVISVFGAVALVSIYQISSRLSEQYRIFSNQFLDNLGPLSATLFASGQKDKMAQIMIQSTRLMGIITSFFLIPLLVYVKPLLKIWLELSDTTGIIVAIILLLSMYVLLFYRSTSVYMLLMANKQKQLMYIAIIECTINLVLSIILIKTLPSIASYFNIILPKNGEIIGVALGTLIPNIILAITFNIPIALKFCNISFKEFYKISIMKTHVITFVYFIVALSLYFIIKPTNLLMIFINSAISGIIYLILQYLFGLEKWEKKQLISALRKKLKIKN